VSTATYSPAQANPAAGPGGPGGRTPARGCLGHPRAACPRGGQLRHGRGGRSGLAAGRGFCAAALM